MPPVSGRWAAWRASSVSIRGVKWGGGRGGREGWSVVLCEGGSSEVMRAAAWARSVGVRSGSMSVVVAC